MAFLFANKPYVLSIIYSSFPLTFARFIHGSIFSGFGALAGMSIGALIGTCIHIITNFCKNKNKYENIKVEMTPDKIQFGTLDFEIQFKWSEVIEVKKGRYTMAIMARHPLAFAQIIIPTRVFQSTEEADSFYKLACEYHPKPSTKSCPSIPG